MTTATKPPTPSPSVPVGLDWQLAIAQELIARGVSVAAYIPDSRLNGVLAALGERDIRLRLSLIHI